MRLSKNRMAALVITSLSTISALLNISTTAGTAIQFTQRSVSGANERINSRESYRLIERSNSIADTLSHIDHDIIASVIGNRMIQTLIDSIDWSLKYNAKSKIKKVFKYAKYRHIFQVLHDAITRDLADLNGILSLSRYNYDQQDYHGILPVLMTEPGSKRSIHMPEGLVRRSTQINHEQLLQNEQNEQNEQKPRMLSSPVDNTPQGNDNIKSIVLPTPHKTHIVDIS